MLLVALLENRMHATRLEKTAGLTLRNSTLKERIEDVPSLLVTPLGETINVVGSDVTNNNCSNQP